VSNDVGNLTQIDKSMAKPAIESLLKAFRDYPLLTYYFPDEIHREKVAYYFVSCSVYTGISYGEVYAPSTNVEGIAIWFPPDTYPVSILRTIKSIPLRKLFGLGKEGGGKMKQVGGYLDKVHKRLAPYDHWFLNTIGIDPRYQGEGYATKLMKPVLNILDKKGLPCYLDTLDEKNVGIYEHFGFKVIEESNITNTHLTNWAMLREAGNISQEEVKNQ